jgi:hypothetical protein
MYEELRMVERVIGLDAHPDSFTAAVLRGSTPATAVVEKVSTRCRWPNSAARRRSIPRLGI